jgi:hypothetical protein
VVRGEARKVGGPVLSNSFGLGVKKVSLIFTA